MEPSVVSSDSAAKHQNLDQSEVYAYLSEGSFHAA
jgi:hypothetical protein